MSKAPLLPLLAVVLFTPLSAQRPPVTTSPSTSTTPSSGNNSSSPTTSSAGSVGDTTPIYVSGKVVTADGSELPQNVAIVRVCSGVRQTIGYANGQGQFHLRVNSGGLSSGVIADASESGLTNGTFGSTGIGSGSFSGNSLSSTAEPYPLVGCELQVSATGFRANAIDLSNRRSLDETEVGTIVITRIHPVDGSPVSATTLSAPKSAQQAFQKGEQLMQSAKFDLAVKEFEKATTLYPKYAAAWLDLGRARAHLNDDAAAAAFQKAIDADPQLVDPWSELGLAQMRQKNWDASSQSLDRALHLNPAGSQQLWFFDAVANYNARHFEAAEKSAREAQRLDPAHADPRCDEVLGMVLFQKTDLAGVLEALRSYLKYSKDPPDAEQVQKQIAELESVLSSQVGTR